MIWENIWTILWSSIGYFLLTLLLPSICLKKYVGDRDFTFRLFFYQCMGNLYLNFSVMLLGFLKFVNFVSLFAVLILLPLALTAWRDREQTITKCRHIAGILKELLLGTYGVHLFRAKIRQRIKSFFSRVNNFIKGRRIEIILFCAVMCWVIWFFGWFKFHNTAFCHTDEETHLYWIGALIHGDMFPAGMYPHGVHTLNAAITTLLSLSMTRVYLCFSILSVLTIFTAAYLLFRKCFTNRYVALAGWIVFVLIDFSVESYNRFQTSFPMEFGLVAAFGMIYGMLSYIRERKKINLVLFGACITWTMMAHFYITILCFIVCACFGIVYLIPIIKRKLLLGFLVAGIVGVVVACTPYLCGYMVGYEFERSMGWALGMVGTTAGSDSSEEEEDSVTETQSFEEMLGEGSLLSKVENFFDTETQHLTVNYAKNQRFVYGLMILCAALAIYGVLGLLFSKSKIKYLGYLFWALLWQICAFMACTYYFNLPTLIEVKRMATFLTFFSIPLFGLPFEILYRLLRGVRLKNSYAEAFVLLLTMGSVATLVYTGHMKEERYFNITITEADMRISLDLCENYEDNTWTVISPTNDLAVIRYDGFHYEIVDLLRELDAGDKKIYIPTPEIFVVTEHIPISFNDDRRKIDRSNIVAPELVGTISGELALQDIDWELGIEDDLHGEDAPYYFQRNIVMSKLYFWMETIKQIYPNHVSVYYKDEQTTVYRIRQDAYFTLNLSVDYKRLAMEGEEDI